MRRILMLLLLLLFIQTSKGQMLQDSLRHTSYMYYPDEKIMGLSPGISYQGQFFGELNFMFGTLSGRELDVTFSGVKIGVEANFKAHDFVYAPKIGYEISGGLFCIRGNVISYIDNGRVDLRILPEIGPSLFGAVNLVYGYSIPALHFRTTAINKHRITLTINLDDHHINFF